MNTRDIAIRLDGSMATVVALMDERIDARLNTLVLRLSAQSISTKTAATRPVPVDRAMPTTRMKRRKGPIQLCPVPGCRERAAPVFGMVCKGHRALPKKLIAKYRAARRAKKA